MLTANPFAQREKDIHLNCSSDVVPFGQTAEFLVNNMTYTNIRKHKWVCFNTKLNKTCSSRSCSCAGDRKSYTLTLKPMKNVNQVTFLCRMKFTGGTVKSSTELVVTILGKCLYWIFLTHVIFLCRIKVLFSACKRFYISQVETI